MKRIVPVALAVALAASGCSFGTRRDEPAEGPPATDQATYLKETAVAPDSQTETPTAVESALVWSEKYAKAVEEITRAQQENRRLADENRQLGQTIAGLQAELAQAQKELQDANSLLIDVRRANDKWKSDVLGYRDEMRSAHLVELDALHKVLRLLGGDVPEPAAAAATTTAASKTTASDDATRAPESTGASDTAQAAPAPTAEGANGDTGQ